MDGSKFNVLGYFVVAQRGYQRGSVLDYDKDCGSWGNERDDELRRLISEGKVEAVVPPTIGSEEHQA